MINVQHGLTHMGEETPNFTDPQIYAIYEPRLEHAESILRTQPEKHVDDVARITCVPVRIVWRLFHGETAQEVLSDDE